MEKEVDSHGALIRHYDEETAGWKFENGLIVGCHNRLYGEIILEVLHCTHGRNHRMFRVVAPKGNFAYGQPLDINSTGLKDKNGNRRADGDGCMIGRGLYIKTNKCSKKDRLLNLLCELKNYVQSPVENEDINEPIINDVVFVLAHKTLEVAGDVIATEYRNNRIETDTYENFFDALDMLDNEVYKKLNDPFYFCDDKETAIKIADKIETTGCPQRRTWLVSGTDSFNRVVQVAEKVIAFTEYLVSNLDMQEDMAVHDVCIWRADVKQGGVNTDYILGEIIKVPDLVEKAAYRQSRVSQCQYNV